MTQHPQCKYLLRRGMSVLCIDSTDPPRRTDCDHCIDTICFGKTHTPAAPEQCKKCYDDGYSSGIRDAAATIRNETLDALRRFIEKNQCDGSCPFDSMNEGNCNEYETCDLCVYDHAANSLRTQSTEATDR